MPGNYLGKINVLGLGVSACTYESAADEILRRARERQGGAVTASAVHLVMEAYRDSDLRWQVNTFDVVTPDGQPIRWALNWLHNTKLKERVYGPELTLRLCHRAAELELPIYLYGASEGTLEKLVANLREMFPALIIAGSESPLKKRANS